MAFAHDPTNPANMSPEERVAEIAAILALPAAVLADASALEIPPESA